MLRHLVIAAALLLPLPTAAQRTRAAASATTAVQYQIAFPNAAHHEAEITATWRGVPVGRPLELRMSRSSPGRYALHEFAKNVYAVRAVDGRGRTLRVTRPNPYQWDVQGHDGTVTVTYTLFGDRADGTYSGIDRTHAHLNIPATFMFARGLDRPVRVTFRAPDPSWTVATQLAPTNDPFTFTAPGLQYFMDSPTEVSAHALRSWTVSTAHGPQTIRVALHHQGTTAEAERYLQQVRRIVPEAAAVFGGYPRFDYGTYTFLADYLPWVSGDGMEHRNSTVLSSTRPLATGMQQNLGTVSHEFVHAWNVERMRPRCLEPFDFERENMCNALWVAEGFTQYYGNLLLRRSGVNDTDWWADGFLTPVLNTVLNAPGRRYFSPPEMSEQAPFVDAATSIDPQNKANTFISYYTWGAGIALALDLELRQRFGRTLDDVMQAMWKAHPDVRRPYTIADVRATLERVSGDRAWTDAFWTRYVTGREAPDYARLLAPAGFVVRPAAAGAAWIGDVQLHADSGRVSLAGPSLVGTPLYQAGLDRGDVIVTLDGRPVAAPADVDDVLARRRPGDAVPVTYESRGARRDAVLRLAASPRVEVVTVERAGQPLTDAARRLRDAWLGSKAEARDVGN